MFSFFSILGLTKLAFEGLYTIVIATQFFIIGSCLVNAIKFKKNRIFPKEVQEILGISEGDILDVSTIENKLILETHLSHHSKWKFPKAKLTKKDKKWLEADLEDDNESPRW